jgi:hypothetical protein
MVMTRFFGVVSVFYRAFTVVDIKPRNMEELKEVVTCAAFHPRDAHTFLYSTSRGSIKVRPCVYLCEVFIYFYS